MTGNRYVDFMLYYTLPFHRLMMETEISHITSKEVSYPLFKKKQEHFRRVLKYKLSPKQKIHTF